MGYAVCNDRKAMMFAQNQDARILSCIIPIISCIQVARSHCDFYIKSQKFNLTTNHILHTFVIQKIFLTVTIKIDSNRLYQLVKTNFPNRNDSCYKQKIYYK